MAGEGIEKAPREQYMPVRLNFFDHPKIMQIAHSIGVGNRTAAGMVLALFAWANEHAPSGRLDVSGDWIDVKFGREDQLRDSAQTKFVEEPPKSLTKALEKVGWLRFTKRGVTLVRWDKWNGKSFKNRQLAANRQQRARDKKKRNAVTHSSRSRHDSARDSGVTNALPQQQQQAIACFAPPWPKPEDGETVQAYLRRMQYPESAVLELAGWIEGKTENAAAAACLLADTVARFNRKRKVVDGQALFAHMVRKDQQK